LRSRAQLGGDAPPVARGRPTLHRIPGIASLTARHQNRARRRDPERPICFGRRTAPFPLAVGRHPWILPALRAQRAETDPLRLVYDAAGHGSGRWIVAFPVGPAFGPPPSETTDLTQVRDPRP